MFWNERVSIPKEVYESSSLVMKFFRLLGCFPFVVQKHDHGMYLKWSPFYAVYSFVVGTILVGRAYWELYHSYIKNDTMSPVDKITMSLAHGGWITVYFCGAFVVPSKLTVFFAYVRCINEVDLSIKVSYTKSEKYLNVLILSIAPTLAFIYCCNSYRLFRTMFTTLQFFQLTGAYYTLYVCSVPVFYMVRHLVHGLEKRLGALNKSLEVECLRLQARPFGRLIKPGRKEGPTTFRFDGTNIADMSRTYLKLCDAAELLNRLFGGTITVGVLVAFVQVVQPLYFLVLGLMVPDHAMFLAGVAIASLISIFRNLTCGLQIIEPSYACLEQVRETRKLVSRLISYNDAKLRRQLKSFSVCLGLRQPQINGCSLFKCDRYLITSMINSAVTFMLMLLQMEGGYESKRTN